MVEESVDRKGEKNRYLIQLMKELDPESPLLPKVLELEEAHNICQQKLTEITEIAKQLDSQLFSSLLL